MQLICGDAIEEMQKLPEHSVDLVLTDPPYNIGVTTKIAGKSVRHEWDKRPDYIPWCVEWIKACIRVLKPNGVFYFWHNDMAQIAELLEAIKRETSLAFISFCIWDKGETFRAQSWKNRDTESDSALRSWFNICEYCLHFFNAPKDADASWRHTGLDRINSNPNCYQSIKKWYADEKERLRLTEKDIAQKYTEITGKKPYMLRHYWQNSQFAIPTREVYETVYETLGFDFMGGQGYEGLRREYEGLRNYHQVDAMHCNVWHEPPISSAGRLHTCQKPVKLLRRMIRVSCPPGGTVLDCFMGSGSTGVAAHAEGREFVGIELDPQMYAVACREIEKAQNQVRMEDMIDRTPERGEQTKLFNGR